MEEDVILSELKEYYSLRKKLKEKELPVSDKLEDEISKLEKRYISESVEPEIDSLAYDLLKDLECKVDLCIHKTEDGQLCVINSPEKFPRDIEAIKDEDDEEVENNIAQRAEMKAEAIVRMKKIGIYKDVINIFIGDNTPQVYEPPYGTSYSISEEQEAMVRNAEERYNILVWGVIRSYMLFNGENVAVDCMLYVDSDKDRWESERENLYDGIPHVFTYMPKYKLRDSGSINVYKSAGGTLLRR